MTKGLYWMDIRYSVGMAAAIVTISAKIPQIVQIIKTKKYKICPCLFIFIRIDTCSMGIL